MWFDLCNWFFLLLSFSSYVASFSCWFLFLKNRSFYLISISFFKDMVLFWVFVQKMKSFGKFLFIRLGFFNSGFSQFGLKSVGFVEFSSSVKLNVKSFFFLCSICFMWMFAKKWVVAKAFFFLLVFYLWFFSYFGLKVLDLIYMFVFFAHAWFISFGLPFIGGC